MSDEIDLDSLFDDEFEEDDKKKEPVKDEKKPPVKKKTAKKTTPKKTTPKKKTKKQKAKEAKDAKEKAEKEAKEAPPVASEESTEAIPDDFDDLFDEVSEEEPKKDEKIVKGKKIGDYKDKGRCQSCKKLKDNISGQTGYCFECDEETDAKAKGKIAAEKTVTPKADSSVESEAPEAEESTPELPPKQSTPNRARVAKYKAPTEAELDALSSSDNPEYDDSEMGALEDRTIFAIVGDKGSGKTTVAFSADKDELPDEDPRKFNPFSKERQPTVICCIGLDKQGVKNAKKFRLALWKTYPEKESLVKMRAKAKPTKSELKDRKHPYEWDSSIKIVEKYKIKTKEENWGYIHNRFGVEQVKEIHVWNGVRYYIKEPANLKLKSAEITFEYIKHLLDNVIANLEPDYIVIDAAAKLQKICENVMRWRNNLHHTQGIKNFNLWKERNDYIDHIIDRSIDFSLVSPMFTFFFKLQKIKDKETGDTQIKEPEWVDRIKEESNIVIYLNDRTERGIRRWYGECQSPKDPGWRVDETETFTDMAGNGGINNLLLKNETFRRPKEEETTEEF